MTQKELIGMKACVVESTNPSNIGIEGAVADETKSTITIKTTKGMKKMIKNQNKFKFEENGKTFLIDGKLLEKRPEERIKK